MCCCCPWVDGSGGSGAMGRDGGAGDIAGAGCQSGEHLMLLTAHPQPGLFTHLHTLTHTLPPPIAPELSCCSPLSLSPPKFQIEMSATSYFYKNIVLKKIIYIIFIFVNSNNLKIINNLYFQYFT